LNIATAIGNIRKITNGLTRKSFANDLVVRLAVERLLEVISEASRHIPTEANAPRFTGDAWLISATGFATPITRPTQASSGR
jgi:hypothetical protein